MAVTRHSTSMATTLAQRIADLLMADVMIVDSAGEVLAVVTGVGTARARSTHEGGESFDYLSVNVQVDGQPAKVLVGRPRSSALTWPKVARSLIEVMAAQSAGAARHEDRETQTSMLLMQILRPGEGDGRSEKIEADLDFDTPRVVLVVRADGFINSGRTPRVTHYGNGTTIEQRSNLVLGSLRRFFSNSPDVLSTHLGGGELVALVPVRESDLASWASGSPPGSSNNARIQHALESLGNSIHERFARNLSTDTSIGIGRHYVGRAGLARSYRDAHVSAKLGALIEGAGHVYTMHNIGMKVFVSEIDERLKAELAQQILSPMQAYPELLETLETYFRLDCYQSDVARALSIHRNTLTYRLAKVEEYTSLDPRRFDDAVQLRLALQLRGSRRESQVISSR